MKDSKLIEALAAESVDLPLGLLCAFPPFWVLAPLILLAWVTLMANRISPVVCAKLYEAATGDEKAALNAVICARRNGHPFAFDLWKLKNRLRAEAQRRQESALGVLKVRCP